MSCEKPSEAFVLKMQQNGGQLELADLKTVELRQEETQQTAADVVNELLDLTMVTLDVVKAEAGCCDRSCTMEPLREKLSEPMTSMLQDFQNQCFAQGVESVSNSTEEGKQQHEGKAAASAMSRSNHAPSIYTYSASIVPSDWVDLAMSRLEAAVFGGLQKHAKFTASSNYQFSDRHLPRLLIESMQVVHQKAAGLDKDTKKMMSLALVASATKRFKIDPVSATIIDYIVTQILPQMVDVIIAASNGAYDLEIAECKSFFSSLSSCCKSSTSSS
jgi:hypothetical protein